MAMPPRTFGIRILWETKEQGKPKRVYYYTLLIQAGIVVSFDISSTVSFHSIFCTFWPSVDVT
jgi:hypothetical protein